METLKTFLLEPFEEWPFKKIKFLNLPLFSLISIIVGFISAKISIMFLATFFVISLILLVFFFYLSLYWFSKTRIKYPFHFNVRWNIKTFTPLCPIDLIELNLSQSAYVTKNTPPGLKFSLNCHTCKKDYYLSEYANDEVIYLTLTDAIQKVKALYGQHR